MPTYKLTYFNARGFGELTRWLFVAGDVEYEDVRVDRDQWQTLKDKTPFGQLPVLEVDGVTYGQSNAIARLVAKRTGFAGKSDTDQARADMIVDCIDDMVKPLIAMFHASDDAAKAALKKKWDEDQKDKFLQYFENFLAENKTGFLVGDNFTWADFKMVNALTWVSDVDYTKYPLLKALNDKTNAHPPIADWIKKRPVTER